MTDVLTPVGLAALITAVLALWREWSGRRKATAELGRISAKNEETRAQRDAFIADAAEASVNAAMKLVTETNGRLLEAQERIALLEARVGEMVQRSHEDRARLEAKAERLRDRVLKLEQTLRANDIAIPPENGNTPGRS
jgi:hypothetical protein